jgi:hypothetical protein
VTRSRPDLGHLPAIVLAAGVGLLLCAVANRMARATVGDPMPLYLLGVFTIAAPVFYRLTSSQASVGERLALVCLLGLSLYGVKVIRDAPLFTFSDELIHAFNANQIGIHHHLFEPNSVLKATPYYPGLESATSALMRVTGLSSYSAGILVLAAARVVMLGALFLLFLRVGGSARVAGLAAAIYTCNFNFLFWGAQYSYESLALPLLALIMMALAEREAARREALRAWAVPIVVAIFAVLVTHHLTSYAVIAVLLGLAVAYWFLKRSWDPPNPWRFAVLATLLAAAWLLIVADATIDYIAPVLGDAIEAIFNTLSGEEPPRQLFQSGSSAVGATPFAARAAALAAIALLVAGLPFGLRAVWRRHRNQPFAWIFGIASIGFFGTLALRLAPAAWESGNRLSEFFFIGLAFVLAYAAFEALRRWSSRPRLARGVLAAVISFVLIGNAISGWPWDMQLSRPLRVTAGGRTIVSPPLDMAEWAAHDVREGRFAAPTADANLLLVPGGKSVLTGPYPNVEDILEDPNLASWQLPLLRRHKLRYVVSDLRPAGSDGLRGYYFSSDDSDEGRLSTRVTAKFNRVPAAARIYANGPITVFDLRGRP